MATSTKWIKRCTACGKIETSTSTTTGNPPSGTPTMSGKCPNTSSGKHNPVFEKQ